MQRLAMRTMACGLYFHFIPFQRSMHVCIVGSGPAGFYTAEKLMKKFEQAKVDILERLPTPFGLVRFGVAPDHPETKIVMNQFSRVAASDRCSFFGNVCVGKDVTIEELQKLYDVVVLAYGAESDRILGIPGEDLSGVHSAREFVWWYNGHPDCVNLPVDLQSSNVAVILGQGNVALDIARILLRPVEELSTTDIAEHALANLQESNIRKVYVVGRRGPVQAAFTAKELREVLGLKGVHVKVQEADLVTSPLDQEELSSSRIHRRVYDLLCKATQAKTSLNVTESERELHFTFFRQPSMFHSSEDGKRVVGVQLEKTVLQGKKGKGPQHAVGTGVFEDLHCGLVLKSIGYKSEPLTGIAFDNRTGTIPNLQGRVLSNIELQDSQVQPGLYVVGWLKRGPTGIIGTNLICAEEVVKSIAEDKEDGFLCMMSSKAGKPGLQALLKERSICFISFKDWLKISAIEEAHGSRKEKPREKLTSVEDMLKAAARQ